MHMQTEDPVKAIKKLKAVISNIQKMKIEEQKKAVRSGYDMDILPTDIVTYEKDTLEFLDDQYDIPYYLLWQNQAGTGELNAESVRYHSAGKL